MPISPSDFERAEDYVAGRLPASEHTQFEAELNTNAELAQETAQIRFLRTGLRRLAYRDEMVGRHAELIRRGVLASGQSDTSTVRPLGATGPDLNNRRSLWPYIAAAASVILLLGIGWFFFLAPSSGPSPADLANRFEPPTLRLDPTTRNGEPLLTGPGPDQLARRQGIARDTAAIRAGLTLLQNNKPAEAITRLQSARNCPLPDWQANARWLLALAYLQTDQVTKARNELTSVQKTTYFGQEAGQLLRELPN